MLFLVRSIFDGVRVGVSVQNECVDALRAFRNGGSWLGIANRKIKVRTGSNRTRSLCRGARKCAAPEDAGLR